MIRLFINGKDIDLSIVSLIDAKYELRGIYEIIHEFIFKRKAENL